MDNITNIASQFVNLALKYEWNKITGLLISEMQVLLATVSAAGFNPGGIELGKLTGRYYYEDKVFLIPINSSCPFKVTDQKGEDHLFATGWLDCALRLVVSGKHKENKSPEQLIEMIRKEIKRSIPFQPIQLTRDGDQLSENLKQPCAFSFGYFVNHTRDKDALFFSCVGVHLGVHKCCDGLVYRHRHKNCDVLICKKCHLWVPIAKETETYEELRQFFA